MISLTNRSHADFPADTTKAKKIAHWATTGALVFCMTGGVFELLSLKPTVDGITRLGYPGYIIPALGLGKVLAVLAILWPRTPRLKEWAYAGIAFNMLGATLSHAACHDPVWSIVVCLVVLAISMASWALRPQGRRL
jgi:DoxX-like family